MTPDIERIYQQFLAGRCSRADAERLLEYFQSHQGQSDMVDLIEQELAKPVSADEYEPVAGFSPVVQLDQLRQRIGFQSIRTRSMRRWLPYAAAILIVASAVTWVFIGDSVKQTSKIANRTSEDVAPGGNRAILTLADGSTINLSENQGGISVGEDIRYLDGSYVLAKGTKSKEQGQGALGTQYALLTTPKGGTYQVTLPDGTQVWLNAASSLRYPTIFAGSERVVEITGEGYFAVARDRNKPFKVISHGQTIEVLGTEFNISAYADEDKVKTTLVEGKVKVSHPTSHVSNLLTPGQQAIMREGTIDIHQVDVSQYIAWKSGMFHFKGTPFADVMRQIERWYDVEVVYKGRVPEETFGGMMRRDVSLLTVLDLLKASEIKFYIEGNQLTIE